jgi:hypothetical protein
LAGISSLKPLISKGLDAWPLHHGAIIDYVANLVILLRTIMGHNDKENCHEDEKIDDMQLTLGMMEIFVPLATAGMKTNKTPKETVAYLFQVMDEFMKVSSENLPKE